MDLLLKLLLLWATLVHTTDSRNSDVSDNNRQRQQQQQQRDKLLVVVIDGMRWDHIRRFTQRSKKEFPGFKAFASNGVRTEYMKSVFPAEAFPAWQSINTGVYPQTHEIIGNQFYDPLINKPGRTRFFNHVDERMTKNLKWWIKAEPIWATAQAQGLKFVTFLWGRCDIPWHSTHTAVPEKCENVYSKDDSKTMAINMETALIEFQQGKDAAIIYEDSLGKSCEEFGPLSTNAEFHLRQLDSALKTFLLRLRAAHMEHNVNVVLVSDHGSTYGSNPLPDQHPKEFPVHNVNVHKVHLARVLNPVHRQVQMVVGSGAYAMVHPRRKQDTDRVVKSLREQLEDDDVEVYTKDEIPDHLHWKNSETCPPILILARPGTVLLRAGSNLQRPASISSGHSYGKGVDSTSLFQMTQQGVSGYDPEESDMRGIFMARGPGFKNDGGTYDPIELVDLYDMFCHLLNIQGKAHTDGVWDRFKRLLRNGAGPSLAVSVKLVALALAALLFLAV